ncbi:MAG TPA: aspartate/glutamate racemase family protein [Actinomycetes bacterium]|jgi:maleate isomerase|nr:aspartate/glutamate racemase family protein [Actinomycetes bacterium]
MDTSRRVGLLVPSSNTVMEPDLWRALPPGGTLHTARMYLEDTTPEGENRMLDQHVIPAARDLATARPDLIVFGCTSAGALRGNDYDAELCRRISDLSGVPTVSVIASVRRAIAASGARRVGVVTPYVDALNQRIEESVEADGVEVAGIAGLGISDNFEIAAVPVEEILDFAERTLRGLDIDLAFVSCTNFPAVAALPELRRRLGLPVVTSNQATIAAVLALLDAVPARGG